MCDFFFFFRFYFYFIPSPLSNRGDQKSAALNGFGAAEEVFQWRIQIGQQWATVALFLCVCV